MPEAENKGPDAAAPMSNLRIAGIVACVALGVGTFLGALGGHHASDLLESRESMYNNIFIYKRGTYMTLAFGRNSRFYAESVVNTADELELPLTYTRFMTAGLMYPAQVRSVLEIGGGGARTSWYLHRIMPEVPVTSVELDPAVMELAQKYFGVHEEKNFHLANRDGRAFLMNDTGHYDLILIDAYRGPFVPFHLMTREFYELVRGHLAQGGAVVQNIEPSTMLYDSALKTIRAVFPQVELYPTSGNVVAIAYDGAARGADDLRRMAEERQKAFAPRYALPEMLPVREIAQDGSIDASAKVLTDDFAPVEALKAIERHNQP